MPAVYASMRSAGNAALYVSMGEAEPVVVPNAPTGVTATPTGGTTASFSLTDTNGGTAAYRWQISLVGSGTWADAVGGANPGAVGVVAFNATGGTPATEWLVRARAENTAGNSAWVQAATSFWFDNTGTGGGIIGAADVTAPTLTGSIAITALTSTSYTATCPPASDAVGVTGYQWRLGGTGAWTDIAAGGRVDSFTGRTPASTDSLEMRARDAAGNFSAPLATSIALLPPPDTTPPDHLGSIDVTALTFTSYIITLPAAADDVAVAGYEYSLNGGAYIGMGLSLTAYISGRTSGATDVVQARSFDTAGNRSTPAMSISVTLPAIRSASPSGKAVTLSRRAPNLSMRTR